MTVAVAFVAGLVAAALLRRTMAATLAHPVLARENYRGHTLPTAAGLLLVTAVIAVEGGRALGGDGVPPAATDESRTPAELNAANDV